MGLNKFIYISVLMLLTASCSNVNLEKKDTTLDSLNEGIHLSGTLKVPESLISNEKPLKLKSFYILNLNAFVNSEGVLSADSDGDGLTDQYEIDNGYGPLSVRSKSLCLDRIDDIYGCDQTSCSNDIDADNDSLSQCEEKSIGTSDSNKDTDGDGILDFHEVLRGLDPLKNDEHKDSNHDGIDDHMHFFTGLNLYVNPSEVASTNRIQYSIDEASIIDPVQVFSYDIQVSVMPLKDTFVYKYDSRAIIGENIDKHYLGSLPNGATQNQVLIVYQAETLEASPKSFWFLYRKNVDNTKALYFDVPLNDVEFLEF